MFTIKINDSFASNSSSKAESTASLAGFKQLPERPKSSKSNSTVININNNSSSNNNTIINKLTLNVLNSSDKNIIKNKYNYISNIETDRKFRKNMNGEYKKGETNSNFQKNNFLLTSKSYASAPGKGGVNGLSIGQSNNNEAINKLNSQVQSSKNSYMGILEEFKKTKEIM